MLLRLLAALGVAMGAAVLVWGQPPGQDVQATRGSVPAVTPLSLGLSRKVDGAIDRALAQVQGLRVVPPDPVSFPVRRSFPSVVHDDFPGDGVEVSREPDGLLRVEASRLNLRAGPDAGARVLATLPRGLAVQPLGAARGSWQRVRDIGTGTEGWVAARFLR